VTGASTRCTLLSSTRISMALRQSALTSASVSGSHRFSCSICRSRSEYPIAAAAAAALPEASGSGPLAMLLEDSRVQRARRRGGARPSRGGPRGWRGVWGPRVSAGGKITYPYFVSRSGGARWLEPVRAGGGEFTRS
jgi:hypothetical protein